MDILAKKTFTTIGIFGMGMFTSQLITDGRNDAFIGGLICCVLMVVVGHGLAK